MSGSEVESVNGSSNASDTDAVLQFMCRLCKRICTAAEMDSHRAMHKRAKRKRVPPSERSEGTTLFQQIAASQSSNIPVSAEMERRTAAAELAKKKAERRQQSGKRRSKKHYNHDIEWETSSGS